MRELDVGAMPIENQGRPAGMVTDRDIVVRALAEGRDPASTKVGDIMTDRAIYCREDDPLDEAAEVMEQRQVRRLMVVNDEGRLTGIVSLGDLATRIGDEEMSGEVLEEISEPGHTQGTFLVGSRPRQARGWGNMVRHYLPHNGRVDPEQFLSLAAGAALGAGLMYMLDPDRGRRRRALTRDKLVRAQHVAQRGMGKTARYMRGRATGMAAETRSLFKRDHVIDEQLVARVRSALGRNVSHPSAIHVEAHDGAVTLSGPVLAEEAEHLLCAVANVRGVHEVVDHLDVHDYADVPDLQGGVSPRRQQQGYWSPAARLCCATAGSSLALWGVARRDWVGAALGLAGLALMGRGTTSMPTGRLVGVGAGRRAVDVHKTININAPVERVFEFWADYANFPRFMTNVLDVRDTGGGRSHWTVAGPAGTHVSWDAELTAFQENQVLGWKSVEGATVENAGLIRFQPNERGGTRIDIHVCYNPPGGALGHAVARLFGADPKSEMDQDLLRMKTMIETGHVPRDAAQPAGRTATAGTSGMAETSGTAGSTGTQQQI